MSHRPDATGNCAGGESEASRERQAADLVSVLQCLAAWQLTRTSRPHLEVCTACGALERADRSCQVCWARRAAA